MTQESSSTATTTTIDRMKQVVEEEQRSRRPPPPQDLLADLSFTAHHRERQGSGSSPSPSDFFGECNDGNRSVEGGINEIAKDNDDWIELEGTEKKHNDQQPTENTVQSKEDLRQTSERKQIVLLPYDDDDRGDNDEKRAADHPTTTSAETDPEVGGGEEKPALPPQDTTFTFSESASSASLDEKSQEKSQSKRPLLHGSCCLSHCQSRWRGLSVETKASIILLATAVLLVCFLSTVVRVHQNNNGSGGQNKIFGNNIEYPPTNPLNATPVLQDDDDMLLDKKQTPKPTLAPTTAPVGKVMERLSIVLQGDPDFDPRDIERSSPQYQAVVWMASELDLEFEDESIVEGNATTAEHQHQHFLQLYVLATCYFAWSGKEWKDAEESDWLDLPKVSNSTSVAAVCDWMGVECQNDNNVVVSSLRLPKQELWGTIVSELGLLSALETLDLSQNFLGGTIPSELGRLSLLQTLDLSNNQFLSGSFPSELTVLPSLESMQVQGNPDLGAGMRNFMPCDQAPPTLVADCGLPEDENGDHDDSSGSPPKQPQVLCPCCTECCHYADPATTTKGKHTCVAHEPYMDQKSLSKFGGQ